MGSINMKKYAVSGNSRNYERLFYFTIMAENYKEACEKLSHVLKTIYNKEVKEIKIEEL